MRVVILGGGIGGCMAALRMSESFPDVEIVLYEKQPELLRATSDKTPGRMGLGFHYVHADSAIMYLHETIQFVRRFYDECPDLMIGQKLPLEHPLRNGRYFIVKDSLFPTSQILETYEKLEKEYSRLVQFDPRNAVFGNPKDFYRVLPPKEYRSDVAPNLVDVAIETREHLLNWPNFREFLLTQLKQKTNVKIKTGCLVTDVGYSYTNSRYVISHKDGDKQDVNEDEFDFAVNATWEWVDHFNARIGHHRPPNEIRTNRAKVLVKVKLPDELSNANPMFFCMGPHCMFSNMGNGYGMMTYAPETNKQNSTDLIPPESYLAYINGTISEGEKQEIAKAIILGVAKYIPAMEKAVVVDVKFGTVQVEGEANIFDHGSKMHERDYSGLKLMEYGFLSLACTKLLYGLSNGNKVVEYFREFRDKVFPMLGELPKRIRGNDSVNKQLLANICFAWMRRSSPQIKGVSYEPKYEDFVSIANQKQKLNIELLSKYRK